MSSIAIKRREEYLIFFPMSDKWISSFESWHFLGRRNPQRRSFCRAFFARLAIFFLLASTAAAQPQLQARVDRDVVGEDETLELTVTVIGEGLGGQKEPTLPPLDGFRIVSKATQQSISLINGVIQSSTNYVYELQPTRTGQLRIPPITLQTRGRTLRTEPLTVTVISGAGTSPAPSSPKGMAAPPLPGSASTSGWPPAEKPAAVKHAVDRKTAYVGQQITYTFTFMQCEQLYGDVHYSPASTPGFVAEELPPPPQSYETIHGRVYSIQRRLKALFATAPGPHTIGPASVTAILDPFVGEEQLVADPITVNVLPLPQAGQPADFAGAVGAFTIHLRADKSVIRAGETINCVVEINGTGNIRTLGPPQISLPDWIRVYRAGEQRTVRPGKDNKIGGVAVFSYLLLPRQAGTLRLGPLRYPYFDPEARVYRTATSSSFEITVVPGAGTATTASPPDELRPLKQQPGRPLYYPWLTSLTFWIIIALPWPVLGWLAWQRWQQWRLAVAPEYVRAATAYTLALKRLSLAEKLLKQGNLEAYYAEIQAAILDYIADRTGAPPAGLTAEKAYQLLVAQNVSHSMASAAQRLIERASAGRFAPGAADPKQAAQLLAECRLMLKSLQG